MKLPTRYARRRHDITCRRAVALITDYLEDALLHEMHAAVDEHVMGCPNCSAYYERMRNTIAMLRQLVQEEPTFPGTKEALLKKFREWRE